MSDVLKIQIKALRWFAEEHCGGVDKLKGLTTYDVVETYMRPFVRRQETCPADGTSLAYVVWSEGLSSYGQTGPYICHAWGGSFVDLIETLEQGLGQEQFVWLDILCNNIAGDLPADAQFFADVFYSTVRECGDLVMVWAAVQTKCTFKMLITPASMQSIRLKPQHWSRTFLYKKVGFDFSKCTDRNDHRTLTLQLDKQLEVFNLWVEIKIKAGLQAALAEAGAPLDDWAEMMEKMGTRRQSNIVPPVSILENDLQKACRAGNLAEVKSLVERGANLTGKDSDNNTALHMAAYGGHTAVVMHLVEKKADVQASNHQGNIALHAAAFNGHATTAQRLVEAKSDISARNDQGESPLHVACQRGHYTAAGILLACGAPVNAQDDWGATPLDLAKASEATKHTKPVQDLLKTHGGQTGPKGCKCTIS